MPKSATFTPRCHPPSLVHFDAFEFPCLKKRLKLADYVGVCK
jgi:hypothetical protein